MDTDALKVKVQRAGWGGLDPLLLQHVHGALEAQRADLAPIIRSARLVNRHWCRWASELVMAVSVSSYVPLEQMVSKVLHRFKGVRKVSIGRGGAYYSAADFDHNRPDGLVYGNKCRYDECDLARLQKLRGLTHLDVGNVFVKDAGLECVGALTFLKWLHLGLCNGVSDAGFKNIGWLVSLTRLEIGCASGITDSGFEHLGHLTGLEHLSLDGFPEVTDEGMAHLVTLTALQQLHLLQMPKITDSGMAHVAKLTSLKGLEVEGCEVSVRHVAKLIALRLLVFRMCWPAGDTCLTSLGQLTGLTSLHLDDVSADRASGDLWLYVGKLTNLQHLSLHEWQCIPREAWACLGDLKSLLSLNFTRCDRITVHRGMQFEPFRKLMGLERLEVVLPGMFNDNALAHVGQLTMLTHLNLDRCGDISADGFLHVGKLVRLQHLSINLSDNVSDGLLARVGLITGLKHLVLMYCPKITDGGIAHLTGLTSLELLDLNMCKAVTDGAFAHIGKLVALKRLGLPPCHGITIQGLAAVEGLPALERLDMSGCTGLIDAVVTRVEWMSGHIRLCVSGCRGTTDDGERRLKMLSIGGY
eukprot:evm.model.scf_2398.3 EVM.evm.TU.scf_2398.3   scf_2398:18006-20638(+)